MFDDDTDELNTINNALDQAKSSLQNLGSSSILRHLSMEPVDIIPLGNFAKANEQTEANDTENKAEPTLQQ